MAEKGEKEVEDQDTKEIISGCTPVTTKLAIKIFQELVTI